MEKSNIHIGTSGWSYKHWKGLFYPQKMSAKQYLQFYAQQFSCAEINTSFYRLPKPETIMDWMGQVPEHFIFCPKMSRYLTHMKKLPDPEEPLERFFELFKPMKAVMGPVLIQLPHMVKFNYDVAEHLFTLLQKKYKEYRFVLEPRHATWFQTEAILALTRHNIGLVISQSGSAFPYSEIVTSTNVYLRFHGPAELYASAYSDEALQEFAIKIKGWVRDGLVVWAFFNNDIHGHAFRDAERLKKLV